MPIYQFGQNGITRLEETTFSLVGLHERRDLQRLLREHVEVIAPETLVISEEFGDWQDSRRRIDLLGIDKEANLVVIELKRTEDGGYMDLQSIRYASMVSMMTFDQAADVFGRYLKQTDKKDQDPRATILDFLGWDEPDDDQFAQDVRIILASAEFSKELTSSVLWLIKYAIDIRCGPSETLQPRWTPFSGCPANHPSAGGGRVSGPGSGQDPKGASGPHQWYRPYKI